jgi:SAM-dependent methyltransferase
MRIRSVLDHPLVYQRFQELGGYFGARIRSLRTHLPMAAGARIADIGCGPGFLVEHLPAGVSYIGFDTDARYIEYATSRFGDRGRFHHRPFDDTVARELGPFDIAMMNGVLHHLSDAEADATLGAIRRSLGAGGRLFTLDGCYAHGQSAMARFLLAHDRGRHVRTEESYRALLERHFATVEVHVEHRLSWAPYTWIVMVGHAGALPPQPAIQ